MIDYALANGKTVRIPCGVSDWQLYSGQKGSANAARALLGGLKRVITKAEALSKKHGAVSEAQAGKLFWETMRPLFDKHGDAGAADTEPRNVGLSGLERVCRVITGDTFFRIDTWG